MHVVSGANVRAQGGADLLDLLRTVVPTFNVNAQPIADGAAIVRPPNVRNLAADHTLVLVNGKRRHRGAVIAWLVPKASEGAQGPDLSTIPSIALQRVEVLRDGAAAQYGSDAIAGVMNFVLKDDRDGYQAEAGYGLTTVGDGGQAHVAVNAGLPLPDDGFLNLSAEFGEAGETVRSVQRDDAAALEAAGNPHVPQPGPDLGQPRHQRRPQDLRQPRYSAWGRRPSLRLRELCQEGDRRRLLLPQSRQPRGRVHPGRPSIGR